MRNAARVRGMDRSRGPKCFSFKRFTSHHSDLHRVVMLSGIADSTRKHTEIIFEGTESSCYPWLSMGAEGIVSSTSRSPN